MASEYRVLVTGQTSDFCKMPPLTSREGGGGARWFLQDVIIDLSLVTTDSCELAMKSIIIKDMPTKRERETERNRDTQRHTEPEEKETIDTSQ